MSDDADEIERAATRPVGRRRRDTEPSTPRAIAHGSGPLASDESLAGTAASRPDAEPVAPREGIGVVRFGDATIRVEHAGDVVELVLPDGTRIAGSDDEACELGALLLGSAVRRL